MGLVYSICSMLAAASLAPAAPGLADDGPVEVPPTAWLLTSPLGQALSGAAETLVLWDNGFARRPAIDLRAGPGDRSAGSPLSGGEDVRINQPGEGERAPNCDTQSEVSLARFGESVVAGWLDGGACGLSLSGTSHSGYGYSSDGGRSWTDGGVITPPDAGTAFGDPVLAADADGSFYYATLARDAARHSIIGVAKSTDGGKTFSSPMDASPGRSPAGCRQCPFQDKPWIAVDRSDSPYRGSVYTAWTEFAPVDLTTDRVSVLFSRSTDGGTTFGDPIQLDAAAPTHGTGTQVAVGPDGEVYVLWIGTGRLVYLARSFDGGRTFDGPRWIATPSEIGRLAVCAGGPGAELRPVLNGDIRVKEWPSLAVDVSGSALPSSPAHNPYGGRIYLAIPYRGDDNSADIAFLYSPDRGESWLGVQGMQHDRLRRLNDVTTNDQFHPTVAVDERGTVAVSWYDRRRSVPPDSDRANWYMDVFAAASTDGGATFAQSVPITDVSFPPSRTNPNTNLLAGCYMGEYNGMTAGGPGEFLAAWGDNRDGNPFTGLPDPNVYFDRVTVAPAAQEPPPTPTAPPAVDTTPPYAVTLQTPGPFERDTRIRVSWSAGDVGSGVAGFDVRVRTAGTRGDFDEARALLTGTTRSSAVYDGLPGTTNCFSVRAGDGGGNVSTWSREGCTAIPVDDHALEARGAWSRRRGTGRYLGTYSRSSEKGARLLARNVEAVRAAVLVTTCRTCGRLKAFWNGTLMRTLSLRSSLRTTRRLVDLFALEGVERGTLRLEVGSAGRPVVVEGLGLSRV